MSESRFDRNKESNGDSGSYARMVQAEMNRRESERERNKLSTPDNMCVTTLPFHELGTNTRCYRCRDFQLTQENPWGGNTPTVPDLIPEDLFEQPQVETKPSNPKDIIGSDKVPLGLVPAVTMAYLAVGHLEGDLKYGRANWRETGVRTMIYVDACLRHIEKFKEGEWEDDTTHVPHLANALACLSIIIDAHHAGKLNDDRPKSTPASAVIDNMGEVVKHLKGLHGTMKPTDYLINGPVERG